jgi:hypothetical protein
MGALGVVELERVGEHFEHAIRYPGRVATLEAPVVVDADPGQRGHLLAAEARHLAPAEGAQPGLLRRHVRTPARQELRELIRRIHVVKPKPAREVRRGPVSAPPTGPLRALRSTR